MTDTPIHLPSVRARMTACRDAMCAAYIERDACVEALWLAALAQEHVLLLGPPGTGKSHVVAGLMACFSDATPFDWLLTKFTTPEEILGPLDITKLKAGVSERNPANKMPRADIAFLDETFKANSAILNSLLRMMNERKWDQGSVPLRLLCGASNEMPEDESLAAMFDRFLVRHTVEYIRADANRVKFHRLKAAGKLRAFVPPVTVTLAEWAAARRDVDTVEVPEAIVDLVVKLQSLLADKGIFVSDRRIGQCYGLLKAATWLDGAATVEADHLAVLRFALWMKQDDIPQVENLLNQIDMGPAREALRIIDEAMALYEKRPRDPGLLFTETPKIIDEINKAAKRVATYKDTVSKRAAVKIQKNMTALQKARDDLKAELSRRLEG